MEETTCDTDAQENQAKDLNIIFLIRSAEIYIYIYTHTKYFKIIFRIISIFFSTIMLLCLKVYVIV
jgi:hypothetical protein